MGCTLRDFKTGRWETVEHRGHEVKIADAATRNGGLSGVVYMLDGKFQGFTGDREAALSWVDRKLDSQCDFCGARATVIVSMDGKATWLCERCDKGRREAGL